MISLLLAQAQAPADSAPISLWELVQAGGWVMVPLALASVVTITLVIFLSLLLREKNISTPELLRRMDPFVEREDLSGLADFVGDRPQALARVMDQTLKFVQRHPNADADAIKAVAEAEGGKIAAQLNQRALYLMDVGVITPMLGLFGTVIGILRSFGSIALEASPMRTMLLAGGVSQALVATAAGLIVGITALGCYAFFRGRVGYLISLLESQATVLIQEIILLNRKS